MDATRERDRRALADLAKLAQSSTPAPPSSRSMLPPPKPNPDSSGLIDLQAMMAAQPGWLEDAVARAKVKPPAPSSLAPVMAPLSAPQIATRFDGSETLAPPRKKRGMVATLVALVAIGGAGSYGWMHRQQVSAAIAAYTARNAPVAAAPAPVANDAPTPATAAAPATPSINAPVPSPIAPAVTATTTAPSSATLAAAPTTDDDDTASGKGKRHGKHKGHHAAPIAAADAPAPAAPAPAASDNSIFARAAGASAPAPAAPAPKAAKAARDDSPLGAALREAAGGDAPPAPKAAPVAAAAAPAADDAPAPKRAAAADGRPDRPSPSAVTSALQSQVGAARGCVASASGPSKVRVTFGSEGNVTGVDVSGAAESDPAMVKCLKSAMSKARVPAFAQPSYSASVNVRP